MKKLSLILALCLCTAGYAGAQDLYNSSGSRNLKPKKSQQPKGFDPQRLIFGGGLGLSFGDVTAIAVSPIVGYAITDRFCAGVGLNYQYLQVNDYLYYGGQYFDYKTSILGPSAWMRFSVFPNLFLHAEYEHDFMSFTDYRFDPNGSGNVEPYNLKYNTPAMLLGGGYRQPVSDNSSIVVMGLYDIIQDKYSPYYGRLDIRFGFNVGF